MTHHERHEMGMTTDLRRWSSEPILGDWIPQLLTNLRAQRARRHARRGTVVSADQAAARSSAGPARREL